jgi:hypothetical protein
MTLIDKMYLMLRMCILVMLMMLYDIIFMVWFPQTISPYWFPEDQEQTDPVDMKGGRHWSNETRGDLLIIYDGLKHLFGFFVVSPWCE